jgi:o-succinylbenzoate synthase
MRILDSCLKPYRLPLRETWRSQHGEIKARHGWIVRIGTDSGETGYGDCAPLPEAGTEKPADAIRWLTRKLSLLHNLPPEAALEKLSHVGEESAARYALETALLDLVSQGEQKRLGQWLNQAAVDRIPVSASAGTLDENAITRSRIYLDQGFTTLKFKVGTQSLQQELGWLDQLDEMLPAGITLRLDANQAWSMQQARHFLQNLPPRVESVEEPLSHPGIDDLGALQAETHAAITLDESLAGQRTDTLIAHCPVRRLVIKPAVIGGLIPSLALIQQAEERKIECLITSMLESAIGLGASAHLAAAIHGQEPSLAHGLATGCWLTEDTAKPLKLENGMLILPKVPGLGLSPNNNFA